MKWWPILTWWSPFLGHYYAAMIKTSAYRGCLIITIRSLTSINDNFWPRLYNLVSPIQCTTKLFFVLQSTIHEGKKAIILYKTEKQLGGCAQILIQQCPFVSSLKSIYAWFFFFLLIVPIRGHVYQKLIFQLFLFKSVIIVFLYLSKDCIGEFFLK